MIDLADKNRNAEDVLAVIQTDSNGNNQEEKKQSESSDSLRYGHLSWLHEIIDLSLAENQNIILTKSIENMNELKVG